MREYYIEFGQLVRINPTEPVEELFDRFIGCNKEPRPEPQQNIFFQVLSAAAEMCGVTMEEVNSGRKYGDIPTVKQLTSKILSELKYSQEKINNELPMLGKRNAIQQQVAAATKYAEEKKPFLNVLEQLREKFDIGNRKG